MKINSFQFKNNHLGYEVETIHFGQLSLLVGMSGAGKSQILNALWLLRGIALGNPVYDVSWEIDFSDEHGNQYTWIGEIGKSDSLNFDNNTVERQETLINKITNERIYIKLGFLLFESEQSTEPEGRGGSNSLPISFHAAEEQQKLFNSNYGEADMETDEGMLLGFSTNPFKGFKKMVFRDHTRAQSDVFLDFYKLRFRYTKAKYGAISIEVLRKSGYTLGEKFLIADRNQLPEAEEIKTTFMSIFPEVTDIDVIEIKNNNGEGHIEYRIKSGKHKKWIPHWNISSGMLRVLNYLVEANLSDDDTIFLIDEFENSLGHNCLPAMADDILMRSISQQFIITSHHPDIINEFDKSTWLVISRNNGRIKNTPARELPLIRSEHEPYLSLINHFETPSIP